MQTSSRLWLGGGWGTWGPAWASGVKVLLRPWLRQALRDRPSIFSGRRGFVCCSSEHGANQLPLSACPSLSLPTACRDLPTLVQVCWPTIRNTWWRPPRVKSSESLLGRCNRTNPANGSSMSLSGRQLVFPGPANRQRLTACSMPRAGGIFDSSCAIGTATVKGWVHDAQAGDWAARGYECLV